MSSTVEQLFELREQALREASKAYDEFSQACRVWSEDRFDADRVIRLRKADRELDMSKRRILQLQQKIEQARARFVIAAREGNRNGTI